MRRRSLSSGVVAVIVAVAMIATLVGAGAVAAQGPYSGSSSSQPQQVPTVSRPGEGPSTTQTSPDLRVNTPSYWWWLLVPILLIPMFWIMGRPGLLRRTPKEPNATPPDRRTPQPR